MPACSLKVTHAAAVLLNIATLVDLCSNRTLCRILIEQLAYYILIAQSDVKHNFFTLTGKI